MDRTRSAAAAALLAALMLLTLAGSRREGPGGPAGSAVPAGLLRIHADRSGDLRDSLGPAGARVGRADAPRPPTPRQVPADTLLRQVRTSAAPAAPEDAAPPAVSGPPSEGAGPRNRGEAANAVALAEAGGLSVEEVLALRESGLGWGEVAHALGLTLGAARQRTHARRPEAGAGRPAPGAGERRGAQARENPGRGRHRRD